jgi:hypothetical protein
VFSDKELGALTKELSSWFIFTGSRQATKVHSLYIFSFLFVTAGSKPLGAKLFYFPQIGIKKRRGAENREDATFLFVLFPCRFG